METVPAGHVFLLGDNAAISIDSRSFGPVPETEIVGRVAVVIHTWVLFLALGVAAVAGVMATLALARGRGISARRPEARDASDAPPLELE
jgi:hypothetical protein